MSEEDTKKLEEYETLKASFADIETKLKSVTGELIEGRKTRAEIEAERDALAIKLKEMEKAPIVGDVSSTEDAVRKVLKEQAKQDAVTNRKIAEETFKSQVKDFSSDNDPGGIKFSAVMAEFNRFNTEDVVKTEDFLELYSKAATLANPSKPVTRETFTPYAATPPSSSSGPREATTILLSSREQDIVKRMGWTEQQYLDQKTKRPHYVASLLKQLE